MGDLDVAAAQGTHQLHVVVSRHAQGGTRLDHAHDEPEHRRRRRPAVGQVTHEYRLAAERGDDADTEFRLRRLHGITELTKQIRKFVVAAVDVADDVEWSTVITSISPQPYPFDLDVVDLLRSGELPHMVEALSF